MKKPVKIAIAIIALFIFLLIIIMPLALGSGSTNIITQVQVVSSGGQPIPGAEVIIKKWDGTEEVISKTDDNGSAEIRISAGWSFEEHLLYRSQSAIISTLNYTVQKNGYYSKKIELPKERMYWHTIVGIEFGRPRLKINCVLEKQ